MFEYSFTYILIGTSLMFFLLLLILIRENIKEKNRKKKIIKECGNICFCSKCKEPLNDNSDCKILSDDGLYEYTCNKCKTKNKFHFGIAPVPIYIKEKSENDNIN